MSEATRPRQRATPVPFLAAIALTGCGAGDETTLDALLAAHVATQPRYPTTLRLVYDIETHAGRWRVVTSIRSRPFAYREDAVGISPPAQPVAKVSDGRLAWQPRPGLPGIPLTGDAARSFLARTLVEGRLYLEAEIAGDRARLAGVETLAAVASLPSGLGEERRALIVDQPTAAAITLRLAFDIRDHRLLGHSEPHLDRQAWTRYGDWRRHGDLLLPGTRIDGRSNPDRRTTARLVGVELDPLLADELFAGSPVDATPARTDGGALRVVSDTVPGAAWLVAESCAIDGRNVGRALLDTGASTSVLDRELADVLALPEGGRFVAGTFTNRLEGNKRWIDHLQLGERGVYQVTALTGSFPLTPVLTTAQTPRVVAGGAELLAAAPVFDFARGRLRFRPHPVVPLRAAAGAGVVVEIPARRARRGSPCQYVTVSVRGRELLALLDTGFGGTLFLTAAAADKAGVPRDPRALRDPRVFGQEAGGIGATTRMDLAVPLGDVALGPLRFPEVWARVQSAPGEDDEHRSYEALVGTGALLPFARIGIDPGRAVIEFELPEGVQPGDGGTVAVPALGAFAGAMFRAVGADEPAVTSEVQPGSPAARAGLQPGDRLVSIGPDVVVSQDLAFALRRLWLKPGHPVALNVIRAGTPVAIVVAVD